MEPTESTETFKDFYTKFITEAPKKPGDHGIPPCQVQLQNSDLYDPKLVDAGKAFVRRNFFSVMFAHLIFMMWVFGSKYGRIVILHTGESNNKEASLKRYLGTIMRMWDRWYDGDFSEPSSGANKDLVTVRKIHCCAAKNHPQKPKPVLPELTERQRDILEAMKKEAEGMDTSFAPAYLWEDDDPEVPLSQFHMSMGQWGFMGLVVTYPELFGVKDTTGMDGYVHMWAIIGRQLGIEDEYNWGLHLLENGGDTTELKKIYENVSRPLLKGSDEATVLMLEAMIEGIGEYVWPVRLLPLIKLMLVQAGLDGGEIHRMMNLKDKVAYKFIEFGVKTAGKWKVTNSIRNAYVKWSLRRGTRKYLPKKKASSSCKKV